MSDERITNQRANLLLAVSALAVLVLLSLAAWYRAAVPERDPSTQQELGRRVPGDVDIILDATDVRSSSDTERIARWLAGFSRRELEPNERVVLWVISGGAEGPQRRFLKFLPRIERDEFWHNPAATRRAADFLFFQPLDRAVRGALAEPPSPASYLVEDVGVVAAQPASEPTPARRRVLFVSDLAVNTSRESFYRHAAVDHRLPPPSRARIDLRGVDEVTVLYLPVPSVTLESSLLVYWRKALKYSGAKRVTFEQL